MKFFSKIKLVAKYRGSVVVIFIMMTMAVFAGFIANEKPLAAQYDGVWYFPAFKEIAVDFGWVQWQEPFKNAVWKNISFEKKFSCPIPFSPETLDVQNAHLSPFQKGHYLGTDAYGRDVAAGIVHGCRVSLFIGIGAMIVAMIIGVLVGLAWGYAGDRGVRWKLPTLAAFVLFFFPAFFYGFFVRAYLLSDTLSNKGIVSFSFQFLLSIVIFTAIILLGVGLFKVLTFLVPGRFMKMEIGLPLGTVLARIVEIYASVPALVWVLALFAFLTPSVATIAVVIGVTHWVVIARLTHAEILKIKELGYIEAANVLGYSSARMIVRHILPNMLTALLITFAFGTASAIMTEATFSYLGIGIPVETITWGKMLSSARFSTSDWWLVVFPGLAVCTITISLYALPNGRVGSFFQKK